MRPYPYPRSFTEDEGMLNVIRVPMPCFWWHTGTLALGFRNYTVIGRYRHLLHRKSTKERHIGLSGTIP